ncbi:cupin domain-containing protein [Ferrimonas sp. YFM]|uniref:cupin domain-containing protein n=1 Tax=Ferrimonas sp. YFM TaxID=3028878 RepID=UPI00257376F2|nr:cupin domain-containing protein [Ferrimonas sp. YFM]BDY06082.1 periplasmic RmlC-type Cupin domain family protein [Ferrimonas sp. YFM]
MKKTIAVAVSSIFLATPFIANAKDHSPIPTPLVSSTHAPVWEIPEECRDPLAEKYIAGLESGKYTLANIPADDTIAKDKRHWLTFDESGKNVVECKDGDIKNSPSNYCWKELSDAPSVMGIVSMGKTDHAPHYHPQGECYYIASGKTETLAQNQMQSIEKGQYFWINDYAIHNIPNLNSEKLTIFYWYPGDANWGSFKYRWIDDVKNHQPAEAAFHKVDEIRKAAWGYGPYGTNEEK